MKFDRKNAGLLCLAAGLVLGGDCALGMNARAEETPAKMDTSGHGAVLCSWMLTVSIADIGEDCFQGQDQEYKQALKTAIERTEAFILENSTASRNDLETRKIQWTQENGPDTCSNTRSLYEFSRNAGIAALKSSIDDLLSVPREPLFNPCL